MTLDEFNQYIAQNLDRLLASAHSQLRNRDAAADAVQQAVLRLLDRERYQTIDAAQPHAFVATTLRNVIEDARRRQSYVLVRSAALADVLELPEDADLDSEDSASLAECERLVLAVLAEMSDRERHALRLSLSKSSREAIDEMGTGYYSALSRARNRVAERLGQRRAIVLRLGLERFLHLLEEASSSGHDTVFACGGDTKLPPIRTRGSYQPEQNQPLVYPDLFAYARGQASDAVKERLDALVKDRPRWWQAHLDSIRYLDLERLAARQDGEALACFGKTAGDARPLLGVQKPTEFCQIVARSAGQILTQLTPEGTSPIAGSAREEWEQHVADCVYCRRVQRLVHAERIRLANGLRSDEPLLRDWLLARHYRADLDRITKELGGSEHLPFPTATASAPEPMPSTPRSTPPAGRTPQQLTALAESVLRGEVPRSALAEAFTPAIRTYVKRLGRADEAELLPQCLKQIEDKILDWKPESRSISAWVLEVCRRCAGQTANPAERSTGQMPVPQLVRAENLMEQPEVELQKLAEKGAFAGTIQLDLSKVGSLQSIGLAMLLQLKRRADEAGGRVVLVGVSALNEEILKATRVLQLFERE